MATDSRRSTLGFRRLGARLFVLAALVWLGAPAAFAQRPRPERPYRGLFGGNGADPTAAQILDVSATLSGAYDDNVLAENDPGYAGDPRFQQSGGYGAATVSLDYTKRFDRGALDATGGTSYRYYPAISEMTGFNSWGSVGLALQVGAKTDVRATESVSYSPFFSFASFPGAATAPGAVLPIAPNYPLAEEAALNVYSAASIEHRLTSRASVSADYGLAYTDYRNRDLPFRWWNAGGLYRYRLSTRATARVGYHFYRGVSGLYSGGAPADSHNIDVGIDYSRALSISRKTTFSFTTGTSIYRSFAAAPSEASAGNQQYENHYLLRINASLNRQIGRSWTAGAYYTRDMQYVQGFGDPFFYDTVSVLLDGFASDRARLNFGAAYTRGTVGVSVSGRGYDTAMGLASYQMGLTRWLAVFADYRYYYYVFDQSVPIPIVLSRGQSRHSVSIGLNLWAPLVR